MNKITWLPQMPFHEKSPAKRCETVARDRPGFIIDYFRLTVACPGIPGDYCLLKKTKCKELFLS